MVCLYFGAQRSFRGYSVKAPPAVEGLWGPSSSPLFIPEFRNFVATDI